MCLLNAHCEQSVNEVSSCVHTQHCAYGHLQRNAASKAAQIATSRIYAVFVIKIIGAPEVCLGRLIATSASCQDSS
jgi:hypothetical protein